MPGAQSALQSNIQNAVGTQTVAQNNFPMLANNGNPNTIYNYRPPQGGYVPPAYNARDQWRINPMPSGGGFNPFGGFGGFPSAPAPQMNWGGGGTGGFGEGGWVPPSNNPFPSAPPMGGPLPPEASPFGRPGGGGGGGNPYEDLERREYPERFNHVNSIFGNNPNFSNSFVNQYSNERFGSSNGLGGGNPFGNMFNMGSTSGFDWRQMLDAVSEPWVKGNLWLNGSKQWDVSNGLAGLVDKWTGLPINKWMNNLGYQQAGQSDPQNWMERQLIDHWVDNSNNDGYNTNNQFRSYGWDNTMSPWGNSSPFGGGYQSMFGSNGAFDNNRWNPSSKPTQDEYNKATWGPNATYNKTEASSGGEGCVVVGSYVVGFDRADAIEVGDTMQVVDPLSFELSEGEVSYSETKTMPCVRVTTSSGIELECSTTAPIANRAGEQVLAPDLMGHDVPVMDHGMNGYDKVVSVEPIGDREVRHITVENNFFPAGKEKGRYLLHHNIKFSGFTRQNNSREGNQRMGSFTSGGTNTLGYAGLGGLSS